MEEIKSFSKPRKSIRFQIDDDVFHAAPAIPAETLVRLVSDWTNAQSEPLGAQYEGFRDLIGLVLLPPSFERFSARMASREDPIEIDQVSDVIVWLLGEYGLRPTKPSSDLSDGLPSPASGTGSMESTLEEASMSDSSRLTVS